MKRTIRISQLIFLFLVVASTVWAQDDSDGTATYDRGSDSHSFTVFMENGGWCWFQDPRAVMHDQKVFIGSVRGNGDGEALAGIYDLEMEQPLDSAIMHKQFDHDDHNSPVFHVREDGSVLATFARHNRDRFHYSRIFDGREPGSWSEVFKHERSSPNAKDRVTYMNLYALENEGLLYNFYRGIEFNPTFVASTDGGETWSEPERFLQSELEGRHRPYARYASDGSDTIHVSVTDAHPRNFGNSVYYFAFREGQYFRADGTPIKNFSNGPLRPSEAERVYLGSMTEEKPDGSESVPGSAWTSAVEIDGRGRPHIAYSLYLSNDDHRYRLASWNGARWIDREIAFAGGCLYPRESSYTGLVTIDPVDPSVVIISTDVDPSTGESRGGTHEIYRAKVGWSDRVDTIEWEAVTKGSPVRNIRPMVLNDGERRVVLWQRGEFKTYRNYDLDTVGFVENATE